MGQIWVEVEESDNCGYLPTQIFETRSEPMTADAVLTEAVSGGEGPHVVTGWSCEAGGGPAPITYVRVSDSGAAVSVLVRGGDCGIRLRAKEAGGPWEIGAQDQRGEPYLLLPLETEITPLDST
jgi:hypothetical protein